MHKEILRRTNKTNHIETQLHIEEGDQKLNEIIRTFRENHIRLIQKIEECDKKRDFEQELSRKKMSEKYLIDKPDHELCKAFNAGSTQRPFSQLKTDRNKDRGIKENSRKENINYESLKKASVMKSEQCQENHLGHTQDKHFKMIKIKANKLVPLSMDKLKERLKLL